MKSIIDQCEKEKAQAYDRGFRAGYLDESFFSGLSGDLAEAWSKGYDDGAKARKLGRTGLLLAMKKAARQ